jgi:hypothetical protein
MQIVYNQSLDDEISDICVNVDHPLPNSAKRLADRSKAERPSPPLVARDTLNRMTTINAYINWVHR